MAKHHPDLGGVGRIVDCVCFLIGGFGQGKNKTNSFPGGISKSPKEEFSSHPS